MKAHPRPRRRRAAALARAAVVLVLARTAATAAASGLGCVAGAPPPVRACAAGDPRPNVVFVLFDDLGYGDLEAYGQSFIETPSIESQRRAGVRFTQYYASPTCSPTRVSLLSGAYEQRLNIRRQLATVTASSLRGIPRAVLALPAMLAREGYATGHFGKWHAGFGRPEFRPLALGFDEACTLDEVGGLRYCDPRVREGDDPLSRKAAGYTTDLLFGWADDFVARHAEAGCPFYLQIWEWAPHRAERAPSDFGFDLGGCQDALAPLLAKYDAKHDGDGVYGAGERYAAIVEKTDQAIGRLWDRLQELGIADNTLVLIASDNGGVETWQGLPPTNGPFTGVKGEVLEGGIRVPLVARWNAGIPDRLRGGDFDGPVNRFELYSTLAELAGADLGGLHFDGQSFATALGRPGAPRRPEVRVWEHLPCLAWYPEPNREWSDWAVRRDDWKLVYDHPSLDPARCNASNGTPRLRLFDLGSSLTETAKDDLAAARPAVVAALREELLDWRRRVGRLPFEVESETGVERRGRDLRFAGSGGRLTLRPDARYDFHDGDFSFAARVLPAAGSEGREAVIAGKEKSWELAILPDRRLALRVWDDPPAPEPRLVLVGERRLEAGRASWIAFAIAGFRLAGGDPLDTAVQLYVDDAPLVEDLASVKSVAPNDNPVVIGADAAGGRPFRGSLRDVELFVASLSTEEVRRLRDGELLADGFEGGAADARWSRFEGEGARLAVEPAAALSGGFGLEVEAGGAGEAAYLSATTPADLDRLRAGLRVDLATLPASAAGARLLVVRDLGEAPRNVGWLEARRGDGRFEVRAVGRLDSGAEASTDWLALPGPVASLELAFRAADPAFGDGRMSLAVLDGPSAALDGLAFRDWRADRVDVGWVDGGALDGPLRLDDFELYRD